MFLLRIPNRLFMKIYLEVFLTYAYDKATLYTCYYVKHYLVIQHNNQYSFYSKIYDCMIETLCYGPLITEKRIDGAK